MKKIPLSMNRSALVDDSDFDRLSRFTWNFGAGYAVRKYRNKNIRMAVVIMRPPKGMMIDHINHDTLDNRRINLRLASAAQNAFNRQVQKHSSRFKGVTWYGRLNKWLAQIKHNQHLYYLGLYRDEAAAARAYDTKARELFGEFAHLNFPNG